MRGSGKPTDDIERATLAFDAYEKKHKPFAGKGKFNEVGVCRSALTIVNDDLLTLRSEAAS